MNCRSLIIFLFFITCFFENFGQDFSNKGKDFWLGYGYHVRMDHAANNEPANVQNMILYLTSDRNTKVTVEVPGIGYQKVYQVNANSITLTDPLPKEGTQDSRIFDIGVFNRGIHVYSDEPIVAYAHIYNSSVSGATLLFPTATLGREYYSINYAQNANEVNSNSYFFVVAVEDNTTVEITPSAANRNNITPNTPFLVTLNKGQVYSVFGTTSGNIGTDLTGSKIRTVNSGTGGCKRIAVFSGMGKLSLGGNNTSSADNVFAQALPSSAWGLKYLTTPTGTQPNNYFRICVTDPTTNVKLNGVTIAKTFLQNNFFYELKNSTPLSTPARGQTVPNSQNGVFNLIEADKPITVAQYCTTEGQDGNPSSGGANGNGIGGDPEMIYLSPVEQTINKIAVYSADLFRIRESYINVVMKKQGVTSFMLDGVNRANYFLTHPQDANYSYAILRVSAGTHTLSSDSGFNAIAYGFGAFESYGYNAGTNIKDLYQFVTLKNDFASVDFPATCKETPFKLSITLPYKPTAMSWDFKNNPNQSPNAPVNITNPQPDSSFIRDNKTLYVYRLPETYSFSQTGTYPITVTVNNPTPDGCSGEQVINYDVVVYEKPRAKFSINATGCPKDAVIFTDETDAFGRTVTKWNWIPGNGESYTTAQPTVQYTNDGNYQVNLRIITDIGCVSDTTQLLALNKPPVISFTYSDSCAKNNIVFKSLEQNNNHTITTWNWDFGNGQKLTANAPTNQQQTYLTAGSYNVSLQVETSKGCKSDLLVKTLVVNPLPQVAFNLPALCLPTGRALFFDGSTLAGETNPLFNYAWNFGDGNTSTEKNPIHEYATTGPFDVQLKVKTTKGCTDSLTQKLTTVYPQPKASFTHSGNACLRETTQLTNNSNGTGFALTKYYWNYGNGFVEGTAQPSYTYQNPGNYTIQLVVETEKGCLSDTAKANITIHALPKPDFTLTAPFCEKKPIIFTDASLANSGTITKWFWDFGNDNQRTESTANNPSETYNNFGSYTIKLALTNSFGCKSDTLEKNISIYPEPKVGFIVPEVCLKDAFAQFADTSKIADNSENQFTRLWNLNVENITPAPVAQTALTVANPSAVFTKAAKYLVGLQITSKNGCKAYLEQPFTINGSVPIAKLKIDQNKQFCSNDTVRVTDNSKVDFGVITKVIIYWDADNQPNWVTIDENPTSFDGFTGKRYAFKYPVNHFPQSTVSKRIKIVAYSGASCIDSSFETITLLAAPKLVFNPIASICNNISSKLITEALETSGISGIGIFKGTGISSNGNFSPTSLTPGNYTLQYTFTTNNGGCTDSISQSIKILSIPVAKFTISDTTCEKNGIRFSDASTATEGKIVSWQWNFGDNTSEIRNNGNSFLKTYTTASTTPYTASLIVVTDSGCNSAVTNLPVTVNFLPRPNFTMPEICLPDGKGQFVSTSTIPDGKEALFRYQWNFDDPNNTTPAIIQSPIHQYSQVPPPNGYQVKLIITSQQFCIDSITKPFLAVYPPPKASFTVSDKEICVGKSITFTDASESANGSIVNRNWLINNSNFNNSPSFTQSFNDTGNFIIQLQVTDNKNCISSPVSNVITIHPYPILQLGGKNIYVLEGASIALKPANNNNYYSGNDLRFNWMANITPNYLNDATAAVPIATLPAVLDSVKYYLTLTGRGNCAVTDSLQVVILHTPNIPNAFSPNGDGFNQTWYIANIEAYPDAVVEVYNRYGQLVYFSKGYNNARGWDGTYQGKPLPMGTYYYIVDPKNGRNKMSGSVTIIR